MSEKKPLIKRTTTDLENEEEKVWHKQQEAILKKWSEIGSSYRFMHDRSYTKYNTQNFRFALPVIIISTITGTANFAQGTFPTSWQPYVPLGIGFLNLSAGLLTTVAQFLRVSELLEGHRAAAIAYSKFSRNISVELSLPREERTTGGTEFVNTCRNELDRLIEQSPNITLGIIKQFGKRFENTEFMKPEILNITSVQVYRDDKKEKAKQKLEEIKQNEIIRKKFLEGEQQRRESIIAEIMKEQKLQQDNMQRQLEMTKKRKKDNIGISSVEHSMKKLISKLQDADKHNDILTPSSSDQSGDEISPVNERTTKKVVAQIEDISTIRQPLILDTVVEIAQEDDVDGNANDGDDDNSSGGTGEEEISNVVLDITDTSGNDI